MLFVSAICVQKPQLAFQKAKLAFEAELSAADLNWTIIRPTAFFKSLSGQFERVRAGKPYLMFDDGAVTRCTPISDDDLGRFIAQCVHDPNARNAILPIGGPKPALTPREQGEILFRVLGLKPRFRRVPLRLLDVVVGALEFAGRFSKRASQKAEFARIGRYYATQSMLVWDEATATHSETQTPAFGSETLEGHFRKLAAGDVSVHLGEHAVFAKRSRQA